MKKNLCYLLPIAYRIKKISNLIVLFFEKNIPLAGRIT